MSSTLMKDWNKAIRAEIQSGRKQITKDGRANGYYIMLGFRWLWETMS